jgi:protein-S-isoprenylcysteine O-methyltransferase Ste14
MFNMQALELKIPPPLVGALVAALMWGLASLPPALPLPSSVRLALAGVLAAVGVAFDLLGLVAFLRRRTTVNPLRPERASSLVTGGIYRVTRNPMYVGLAFLLTAWAVYLSSLWPFVGPVLFVVYITRFQIRPEERVLRQRFGEYESYASRVRRWL